jgi:hypothetical protein
MASFVISNTVKGARLLNLRHTRVIFKLYPTLTSLVRYNLNLTLGCHRFYYLAPLIQSIESILKCIIQQGPLCPWSYGSWIYNYLCNQCLSPLKLWVWTLCNIVCQWFCWWFSSGPLVSSTNKTDRHDIAFYYLAPLPVVKSYMSHLSISNWYF